MNAHDAPMVMGTYDRIAYELYDQQHQNALSATDPYSPPGSTGSTYAAETATQSTDSTWAIGKTVLMTTTDRLRASTCAEGGGERRGGCST